jgi:hypothetical protein
VTTEHFTLQGARTAAITESTSRATIFIGSQRKAGEAGHEVELGRVGQAQADRPEDEAVAADVDVVLIEDLGWRLRAICLMRLIWLKVVACGTQASARFSPSQVPESGAGT